MKSTLIIIAAFAALLIILSCVDDNNFNHQYGIYENESRIENLEDQINEAKQYQFNLTNKADLDE